MQQLDIEKQTKNKQQIKNLLSVDGTVDSGSQHNFNPFFFFKYIS